MPDRFQLREGDVIRLLTVPEGDRRRHGQALDPCTDEDRDWTAYTIERIIANDPLVAISHLDEDGNPWFERELTSDDGAPESHFLMIMDDESWELASKR